MITAAILFVTHLTILGVGILLGPKIEAWLGTLSAAKAVHDAKSLISKTEADADKLDKAHKLVAAQPKPPTPAAA
jgi:hypothetical protein